jgi:replicative DNA helicase
MGEEVGNAGQAMKELAMELQLPVIAICQLSRACESTKDKRPELHHLRESGRLEQDADFAAFLYRPERYGIQYDQKHKMGTLNLMEIMAKKHRGGPIGDVLCNFFADQGRFREREMELTMDAPSYLSGPDDQDDTVSGDKDMPF